MDFQEFWSLCISLKPLEIIDVLLKYGKNNELGTLRETYVHLW